MFTNPEIDAIYWFWAVLSRHSRICSLNPLWRISLIGAHNRLRETSSYVVQVPFNANLKHLFPDEGTLREAGTHRSRRVSSSLGPILVKATCLSWLEKTFFCTQFKMEKFFFVWIWSKFDDQISSLPKYASTFVANFIFPAVIGHWNNQQMCYNFLNAGASLPQLKTRQTEVNKTCSLLVRKFTFVHLY